MNRGGYFYPTDLTFSLSLHGWRSFLPLCTHPGGRSVLSDNIDYMEAFAQALMLSLDEDPDTSNILGQSCKSGDSFQPTCKKIVRCLFNIFSKNYVSDLNSRSHGTKLSTVSEHGQLQAKARKLQGF